MNQHSAPPGGWEPPEPSWMRDLREIDGRITVHVNRYIRWRKFETFWWMIGGLGGYWIGYGTVELFKWWAGVR